MDKDGVAGTGWTYGMVEGDNILAASLTPVARTARFDTVGAAGEAPAESAGSAG